MEAIGTYSNTGHLCKKLAELRKRIQDSPPRSRTSSPPSRSKRFLTPHDVADIADRYEAGDTTEQIGKRYGISKTRAANVLHERGVVIRPQGVIDREVSEAAKLYAAGNH